MFYLIKSVQTNIGTVSTIFSINKIKNIDIKMFYSIKLVQTNIKTGCTKFSINK